MVPGDPGGPGLPAGPSGPGRLQTSCEEWMVMLRPFLSDWQETADSRQNITHIWSMLVTAESQDKEMCVGSFFKCYSLYFCNEVTNWRFKYKIWQVLNKAKWIVSENWRLLIESDEKDVNSYSKSSVVSFTLWHKTCCVSYVSVNSKHRLPYTTCFCDGDLRDISNTTSKNSPVGKRWPKGMFRLIPRPFLAWEQKLSYMIFQ